MGQMANQYTRGDYTYVSVSGYNDSTIVIVYCGSTIRVEGEEYFDVIDGCTIFDVAL